MANKFTFELEGMKKLLARIQKADEKSVRQMEGALNLEAERIMTKAKRRTPVAPHGGTLRSSGHVKEPVRKRNKVTVELGFGGAASAYALAVHEHPSRYSPPSWDGKTINWNAAGTGPKYLETPVREAQKGLGRRVARYLDLF